MVIPLGKTENRSLRSSLSRCLTLAFFTALLPAQEVNPPTNTLIILKNQDVAEDVIVFSRSVLVRGVARQGVAAFGGSVVVEGTVRGDVAVVGGVLEIKDGGIVHGDVIVVGGKLEREPMGRIDGRIFSTSVYEQKLANVFTRPSKELLSVDYSTAAMGWRILRTVTWFILSVLLFKIFPMQVTNASRRLKYDLARVSAVGLVSTLALLTALFVFLVLCIILVGVPLIIIWVLFCAAAWIFGSVVFYFYFGQLVGGYLFKGRQTSPALFLLMGVVVYGLLRMVPILTFLLPYVVLVLGLGVVVSTKFGTGVPWFRKPVEQA